MSFLPLLFALASLASASALRTSGSLFGRSGAARTRSSTLPTVTTFAAVDSAETDFERLLDSDLRSIESERERLELERWTAIVQTPEVRVLRQNLVLQFLRLGKSPEFAAQEVDDFLRDPRRSRNWVRQQLNYGWGYTEVVATMLLVGALLTSAVEHPLI